jgi:hypothetical protein
MKRLTANLLDHGDYNVIIVNWGGGSMPMYSQATSNTRVVGLEIGHMVNTMIVSETTKLNFLLNFYNSLFKFCRKNLV